VALGDNPDSAVGRGRGLSHEPFVRGVDIVWTEFGVAVLMRGALDAL
jgi:hypothetical protein